MTDQTGAAVKATVSVAGTAALALVAIPELLRYSTGQAIIAGAPLPALAVGAGLLVFILAFAWLKMH